MRTTPSGSGTHAGSRVAVLDFAVLGLLHESPLHGYELRKRLNTSLGSLRAFSYGSLYPCLRRLQHDGLITVDDSDAAARLSGRSKVVYTLTAEGKEQFADLLGEGGPSSWEDESFGVHMRFFAQTDAATRLRILEGRRSRVEERREGLRSGLARTRERLDNYTLKLQEHGLEAVEHEVRWLSELIDSERHDSTAAAHLPASGASGPAPAEHAVQRSTTRP